jgi:hypothetical protein
MEMKSKKKEVYALFAIRPSGFENFQSFLHEFRGRKISVGFEPIEQNKTVKLMDRKVKK